MTAPELPREVFCFVEDVGDEQFPHTLVTVDASEKYLAAWREGVLRLKEAELSPVGRYMLVDDELQPAIVAVRMVDPERERLRDAVVAAARGRFVEWTRDTYCDLEGALSALDAYESKERGR